MTFIIREVDWETASGRCLSVRYKVFVEGQNVPAEIEFDGRDPACIHLLATDLQGEAIGTARVDATGHIGRVAVLESWRGQNVGRELMLAAMDCVAALGLDEAHLNSQTSAAEFYRKLGFAAHGEEFVEAGIPHVAMSRLVALRHP